ncbi:MAG: hypothetical protein ACRDOF_10770 [Gaiellaceae bacterium]
MSRVLSGTAFAVAALAFTLPFGVVSSCDGAEVHFTGTELVTFSVPAADAQDVELRGSLERGAGPFALAALIGTALGLVLSIFGRPGAGRCAALGVVAMQLSLYAMVLVSDDGDLLVGYWLALASFVVAGLVSLIREVRGRRRARRSVWSPIGYSLAVLLPPVGLVVAASAALILWLVRTIWRAVRPRRRAY